MTRRRTRSRSEQIDLWSLPDTQEILDRRSSNLYPLPVSLDLGMETASLKRGTKIVGSARCTSQENSV